MATRFTARRRRRRPNGPAPARRRHGARKTGHLEAGAAPAPRRASIEKEGRASSMRFASRRQGHASGDHQLDAAVMTFFRSARENAATHAIASGARVGTTARRRR
jgi:hypothetical protein